MEKERLYKPGDVIASLYEVRKVFAGGMGEVYLVYHRERRKLYALKTIQERFFRSKDEFLAFKREAEVWILMGKHPNIVQAMSVRDFEGRLFLVLEYIEPDPKGRNTLSDHFAGEPLPIERALLWALQFCDGMIYAKNKGLKCHRDICPRNIMITKDMVAKVTDFGLAKTGYFPDPSHPAGGEKSPTPLGQYDITSVGYIAGKPAYMSPQALNDYRNADETDDIYSFGVVLFQMLSGGERPFNPGMEDFEIYRHLHRQNTLVPELDSPLFPVVKRCLAKEKGGRYQSFTELRIELESYHRRLLGKEPPSPMEATYSAEDIRHFSQALFELKHHEEALKNCDKSLSIDKEDYEAWNLRGMICQALKRDAEAFSAFEKAIAIEPSYYAPWNNKGMIFQERGETENALLCFRRVISLRPNYREAWNNIGVCLQIQGKFEEAIKHYRKAVELDPRYRDAWLNMGDCFIRLRQYREALNCYERAEDIDPYEPYILGNLEKLYRVLGYLDKAEMTHKKAEGEIK